MTDETRGVVEGIVARAVCLPRNFDSHTHSIVDQRLNFMLDLEGDPNRYVSYAPMRIDKG